MEGNEINYAIRLTFGFIHGVFLTLIGFGLALFFPSLSHFLFGLFGCIITPLASLFLTIGCNACIQYITHSTLFWPTLLRNAWIPPLGIFLGSLLILPLELMQTSSLGPVNILLATSIFLNMVLSTILQIYVGKTIQSSPSGSSGPI